MQLQEALVHAPQFLGPQVSVVHGPQDLLLLREAQMSNRLKEVPVGQLADPQIREGLVRKEEPSQGAKAEGGIPSHQTLEGDQKPLPQVAMPGAPQATRETPDTGQRVMVQVAALGFGR
jgi:hypothetical protein